MTLAKMQEKELKNYLKFWELKISVNGNKWATRVFSAMGKSIMPAKTAVEVQKDLKKNMKNNRLIQ